MKVYLVLSLSLRVMTAPVPTGSSAAYSLPSAFVIVYSSEVLPMAALRPSRV
ncbi:MAG: hypothetical protein IIZ66_06060 [Clostridia bacterium]|nr:hypothetical protein [Clostridia bacterium]